MVSLMSAVQNVARLVCVWLAYVMGLVALIYCECNAAWKET